MTIKKEEEEWQKVFINSRKGKKRFKQRSSGYFIQGRSKNGYFLAGEKSRKVSSSVLLRPKNKLIIDSKAVGWMDNEEV